MSEFFTNRYVVQVKGGHPSQTSYNIISTREGMTAMVQALSETLHRHQGARQILKALKVRPLCSGVTMPRLPIRKPLAYTSASC